MSGFGSLYVQQLSVLKFCQLTLFQNEESFWCFSSFVSNQFHFAMSIANFILPDYLTLIVCSKVAEVTTENHRLKNYTIKMNNNSLIFSFSEAPKVDAEKMFRIIKNHSKPLLIQFKLVQMH